MPKKKVKLVDDWKDCWKWLSVQFTMIGMALSSSWAFLSPQLQNAIPNNAVEIIAGIIFILIALGRIIDQKKDGDK